MNQPENMRQSIKALSRSMLGSPRDLTPILLVVALFSAGGITATHSRPIQSSRRHFTGYFRTEFFHLWAGMGLFPIGESMAYAFAQKGSVTWLLLFAFALRDEEIIN